VKILVVDDHPDASEIICSLLTLFGHEAREAVSGGEAVALAAVFEPEVVILDIGLPDLSGYEVARELRSRHPDKGMHIAAITGWAQVNDRVRSLAAGIDQHFLKPVGADTILAILAAAQESLSRFRSTATSG
jgi:DNA-binding response OmpR family regulator